MVIDMDCKTSTMITATRARFLSQQKRDERYHDILSNIETSIKEACSQGKCFVYWQGYSNWQLCVDTDRLQRDLGQLGYQVEINNDSGTLDIKW